MKDENENNESVQDIFEPIFFGGGGFFDIDAHKGIRGGRGGWFGRNIFKIFLIKTQ